MPPRSFPIARQINWACLFFLYVSLMLQFEDSNCLAFMSSASYCRFPCLTGCYDISLIHGLVKKIILYLQRLWHVYFLFSNKFLSEWKGEAGFLFWYFTQCCVSVKGVMASFVYCSRTIMAFDITRLGFRFQLGHTPGYVTVGKSLALGFHGLASIFLTCELKTRSLSLL